MVCFRTRRRDCAVGIVTSLRLDNRGTFVRLPTEARNLSPLRRVHTGYGSHPAFCPVSTGDYFRRSTASGAWSYTSTPSYDFMACIATTLPDTIEINRFR
jgi:hypothetical protein